jgi:serine/threonine protein kinase
VQTVGKYELKELIGKGSTASVYRAVDTFSGGEIALKVIDPRIFSDPESGRVQRRQFLNEASLAGQLQHPHIVSIVDAVVTEDPAYIAMEYVAGGNVSQYTAPEKLLPIEDAIQIGFKCCGALDYAYRHGIVHRDIKPKNIMVVEGTEVKIADFGSAYLHASESTQAMNIGSPAYMSPEQILGDELTFSSDMYCLGVVLYQLLTGKLPFIAQSINAVAKKIVNDPPAAPSEFRKGLPAAVDAMVLRALAKRPAERYPSWAEFALELAELGRLSVYRQSIPDSARFQALKRVALFSTLNDAELWELVRAGCWTRLPAQSPILREGEPGHSLCFLAEGEAKVTRDARLVNVLSQGECFGEMGYIRGGETLRHATVESLTDVVFAEFEAAALERMSERCQKHLLRALVVNLVERLQLADARVAHQVLG